ncbi:MAG: type II toxin-antitoxin system ParD family antitoxin [Cyanobacteriota bacterium]|nr:type II toxin-antitoxin system ParD family antitoxin [Cyanobacteriota bacterium]
MISITLTPEQEQFLQDKLKSGKYNNPQEVISEALKLLEKEDTVELPAYIKGSDSAKKLLVEKITKFRKSRESTKNKSPDPERDKLSREMRQLFQKSQSLPGIKEITDEEIAAEIEAYRRGE